jgi:two-component system, OmpR family, response regulator
MRLLVVEDDRRLAAILRRGLSHEGFGVDVVGGGEDALVAVRTAPFDVILLDVMLPGETDGFRVCQRLRDLGSHVPVLMLTACDTVEDRVRGLDAGADDYLVKPFDFSELLARIRALTRRHSDRRATVMRAGPLEFDTVAREARVWGEALGLTLKELAILEYFMRHPGALLTSTQIKEHVWNYEFESESNLVEVYMARLRRRLTTAGLPDPWITVRGTGGGYRFVPGRLSDPSPGAPAPV